MFDEKSTVDVLYFEYGSCERARAYVAILRCVPGTIHSIPFRARPANFSRRADTKIRYDHKTSAYRQTMLAIKLIVVVFFFPVGYLVVSNIWTSILETSRFLEHHQKSQEQAPTSITTTVANATRQPLSSFILDDHPNYVKDRNQTIIGDPQFLLDFAIVGFPKCGTSSLSALLQAHPEIDIHRKEMQMLSYSRPADAIWFFHSRLRDGLKRGYKSPFDVTNKGGAMQYISELFPRTKLIVGVRHPIRWFESFYNFRLQRGKKMPPPYELLKRNRNGFGVKAANFHLHLARLSKVNMTSASQLALQVDFTTELNKLPPVPNQVFLYDMEQIADKNETRSSLFRRSLQHYLGLRHEMSPIVQANKGQRKPPPKGYKYINICDVEFDQLRAELLAVSRRASTWIRTYFLHAKDVHVSSREHLEEILELWMHDPCDERIETFKQ